MCNLLHAINCMQYLHAINCTCNHGLKLGRVHILSNDFSTSGDRIRMWIKMFAGTVGVDGMEVLRGWVETGVKRDEMDGNGEI